MRKGRIVSNIVLSLVFIIIVSSLFACGKNSTDDASKPAVKKEAKVEVAKGPIDQELIDTEKNANTIKTKLRYESLSQLEMNECAKDLYYVWDDELNSLWNRIMEKIDKNEKAKLQKEEMAWVSKKEKTVKALGKRYEGGSIRPMIEYEKAAEITKPRTYILAKILADLNGEEVRELGYIYEGEFGNTNGGMEYIDIFKINNISDNKYSVQLVLDDEEYIIKGEAELVDNVMSFVDNQNEIKGNINFYNDGFGKIVEIIFTDRGKLGKKIKQKYEFDVKIEG